MFQFPNLKFRHLLKIKNCKLKIKKLFKKSFFSYPHI